MDLKKSVCGKVIGTLAEIGAGEVKSTGIFTLPGLCRIKTRVKPATKNQSWEKDDVRKGSCGEGEVREDRRQGFRRCSPEAEHLKSRPMNVRAACSPWGCPRSRPKRD